MMRKKRRYSRETPLELQRDYRLFAIACEGEVREREYFEVFEHISSRVSVEVVRDESNAKQDSAPKWVLDRAVRYVEKEGLMDEDELWIVIDTDRWSYEQLEDVAHHCADKPNWHIAISNPCFEVWLCFHKKGEFADCYSSQDFKHYLSTLENGGYHPHKFIPNLPIATHNAKKTDADPEHFMPEHKTTKVYQLAESLMRFISKK